jgi:hypothetical protein
MKDTKMAQVAGTVYGHQAFMDEAGEDLRGLGVPITRETSDAFALGVVQGYIETLKNRSPSRAEAFRKELRSLTGGEGV